MKKLRILHTADLHFDTSFFAIDNKSLLLKHELLDGFCKIIDTAKEYNVDIIVICGDFTDNGTLCKTSYNLIVKKFNEISEIPVFVILGNHDFGFNYIFPKNVHFFSDNITKYQLDFADIYGVNFDFINSNICKLKNFTPQNKNKINIMLQHGNVNGNTDNPISYKDIEKSGFDYIALGHIHSFDGLKKAGITYYAYCGVPIGRGFDETGEKGVVIADISKEKTDVKFVPIATRLFLMFTFDITECNDYFDVLELINEKITNEKSIYKIILTGCPCGYISFSDLNAVLQEKLFYVKLIDKTSKALNLKEIAKEETLRGYFTKIALESNCDSDTIKYGLTALNGERIYIDDN